MLPLNLVFAIIIAQAIITTNLARGSNILLVFTLASHSHRVAIHPLITTLADRNHNVTVFGPIEPEEPNPKIKEFCPKALLEAKELLHEDSSTSNTLGRLKDKNFDPWYEDRKFLDMGLNFAQQTLNSPEFMDWLEISQFDLIIYDGTGKEFVFPMAYKMNAKVIAFITGGSPAPNELEFWGIPTETWFMDVVGNSYSWLPNKFVSTFHPVIWYIGYTRDYLPKMEALCRKVFKFHFPPLEELMRVKTGLVFLNQHFSASFARAYPPFVINVGGMHAKESNGTLPKELAKFVSDAEEFVFISFGSIIKVSELPKEMQQTMFDSVASFKATRFFWKWEGELPKNFPKNVLAKKWFPQQDILAHPKCKGFVTQGGLMSVQQALFHQVPIVVVPGYSEQAYNARTAVHHGYGIYLELADITRESFTNAIFQILRNEKYAKTVKEVSRRFKDRPLSAVDTAVWWTEYILRHDTSHLKSEAIRQAWWQRRSLDFWFLAFAMISMLATVSLAFVGVVIFRIFLKNLGTQ